MWIEWLSVVDIEFMCQKSYVWMCCVFGEKWWMMELWFDELGMNSWLFVVGVVLECVVDELMHWVFIIMGWWCKFFELFMKMGWKWISWFCWVELSCLWWD